MPLDPEAAIQTALKLLNSERYLDIGIGLMLLTGRRPAEIFFAGDFSLPPKGSKSQVPTIIFNGQLKTRQSPNAKLERYPIPVLVEPKLILKHFRRLRELKPPQRGVVVQP
jgi:telomere resolvase